MSGGSGGPIIINNLIDNPDTTAEEKERCRRALCECKDYGACSLSNALRLCAILWRLIR